MARPVLLDHGEIDLSRELIRLDDGSLHRLTTREAALLRFLVERAGEVSTREALQAVVWGYAPDVLSRAVDNTVTRLRRKLEPDPSNPRHLLTVHGEGYRWEPARRLPPAPAPPRGLFGRDEDLARLEQLLERSRLVTVHGPGGVGKTRLARELLARQGGLFVDLVPAREEADADAALGRALELVGGSAAIRAALAEQAPGRVVLDNCEQLGPGLGAWARRLLAAVPELRLVLTSRLVLGIPEEAVLSLRGLDEEAGTALLVERARAIAAPPAEQRELARLCQRLDGLPLALELAAARLGILGPRELLDRLDGALDLLGRPGDEGRHGTLRRTIAWSWSLLPPSARLALARCSVFSGGFDAAAAEAVLGPLEGGEPVLEVLELLRQSSLLDVRPLPGGRLRLGLLEAIRLHASEQLPGGDPAFARHARWAAGLPPALQRQEQENLLAAWAWARLHDPRLALALAEGLAEGFRARGPPERWLSLARSTAGLPGLSQQEQARAALLELEA